MIESTDRQRGLVGWSASILLHAGLLIFGVAWLVQPARFYVEAGKTSSEINLIIEPAPVPATAPPPLTPISPDVAAAPEAIFTPPSPKIVSTAPQLPKPPTTSMTTSAHEAASASRGALQAQPDELHNEPPVYPEESREAREQGVVILRVEVTAAGEPATVSILKSSGYFRLDQAARRAVHLWKFHPAMTAGIPMPSEADVPVRFKLQ